MQREKWPKYSFYLLLIALFFYFVVEPFFELRFRYVSFISHYVLLFLAVYALSERKRTRLWGFSWVVSAIGLFLLSPYLPWNIALIGSLVLMALFLLFFISVLLRYLFTEEHIGSEAILGAITGYIFLGVFWGLVFHVLELVVPGSFSHRMESKDFMLRSHIFIYYSFVTLTTLGYGDIVALRPEGQSLSVLEAIMGQIYITVIIAQFVALRGSLARKRVRSPRSGSMQKSDYFEDFDHWSS